MPMAEYERDQLEQIEAEDLKRLSKLTDELGRHRGEVAREVARNRAALPGATEQRVRTRLWKYTR